MHSDVAYIADSKAWGATQPEGSVAYCFGDTTIIAREKRIKGNVQLESLGGEQVSCGEWYDLSLEEVAAYCKLIEDSITEID